MPKNKREPSENPTFVFRGTVKKVGSTTVKQVMADDRTLVVRVDQIIEAPKLMAGYAGRDITVQAAGRAKFRAGQEMLFHTVGWIFAETVAVRSLSQEPLKPSHLSMMSHDINPVERSHQRKVEERVENADVVISGMVSAVRLPETAGGRGKRGMTAEEAAPAAPVSEHNAHWREAVIEVHDVHKGQHDADEIVVSFPASTDVRWYRAPKFEPGQQGYFILRKTEVEDKSRSGEGARGMTVETPQRQPAEAYTALHPADFQPYHEPGGIKHFIQLNPAEGEG